MADASARPSEGSVENSKLTPLQVTFKRIPMLSKLDVWDVATNPEKDELYPLLWKARESYMQRHSPMERNEEPVWQRMQIIFPDLQARSPRAKRLTPTHVLQGGAIVPVQ